MDHTERVSTYHSSDEGGGAFDLIITRVAVRHTERVAIVVACSRGGGSALGEAIVCGSNSTACL